MFEGGTFSPTALHFGSILSMDTQHMVVIIMPTFIVCVLGRSVKGI